MREFILLLVLTLITGCSSAPSIEQDRASARQSPVAPQAERVGLGVRRLNLDAVSIH